MLVIAVPATEVVGVANSINFALVPFARVPTFHIPVTLL